MIYHLVLCSLVEAFHAVFELLGETVLMVLGISGGVRWSGLNCAFPRLFGI